MIGLNTCFLVSGLAGFYLIFLGFSKIKLGIDVNFFFHLVRLIPLKKKEIERFFLFFEFLDIKEWWVEYRIGNFLDVRRLLRDWFPRPHHTPVAVG